MTAMLAAAGRPARFHCPLGALFGAHCGALFGALALATLGLAAPAPAQAQTSTPTPTAAAPASRSAALPIERLQVRDAFIDLRTGPGRGYPVVQVIEKGQWLRVELRRTDWYRVRSESTQGSPHDDSGLPGRVGWVHRSQLERTLTEDGAGKTFGDVVLDDYLARRVEFGLATGRMRSEPLTRFWGTWRAADTLAVEAAFTQVQGTYASTGWWQVSLVSEPWSDQRWSPFFSLGLGRLSNRPNSTLVADTPTKANVAAAGLGLRWHVSERFVARIEGTLLSAFASDTRTAEYRAVALGLSFFY